MLKCWSPGVPDRNADQGLHRGGARAGVAGRGAGGGPVRRGSRGRGRFVTRGAPRRLVPVLPRPPVSSHRCGHGTVPVRLERDTDATPLAVTSSRVAVGAHREHFARSSLPLSPVSDHCRARSEDTLGRVALDTECRVSNDSVWYVGSKCRYGVVNFE